MYQNNLPKRSWTNLGHWYSGFFNFKSQDFWGTGTPWNKKGLYACQRGQQIKAFENLPPSGILLPSWPCCAYLIHTKDNFIAKEEPTGQVNPSTSINVYNMHLMSRKDSEISGQEDMALGGNQTRSWGREIQWGWAWFLHWYLDSSAPLTGHHSPPLAVNTYIIIIVSHHSF